MFNSGSNSGPAGDAASLSSPSKASFPNSNSTAPPQPPAINTSPTKDKKKSSKASQLIASAKSSFANTSSSATNSEDKNSFVVKYKDDIEHDTNCSNSAGDSKPGPKSTFRVGVTEDKNKKCRRTMEDTHSYLYNFLTAQSPPASSKSSSASSPGSSLDDGAESDNGYFAIFDGHAGTYAADWCGKKLHIVLEDMIKKHPNTPIPELLDMTFTNCDGQLEKLPVKNSGCTAVCAVLRWEERPAPPASASTEQPAENGDKNTNTTTAASSTSNENAKPSSPAAAPAAKERQRVLYTANVGDARIVLCRGGKALRLSYDHKGSDEVEGKRVANAGGLILNNRVNGVLAVTRALGDSYMKELVTGHPYTTETILRPGLDEFIILACDGLWDVCSDQEAVDLVRATSDPQQASKMLVDYALSRFSSDNLSCMIVRLDPTGQFTNASLPAAVKKEKEGGDEVRVLSNDEGNGGPDGVRDVASEGEVKIG